MKFYFSVNYFQWNWLQFHLQWQSGKRDSSTKISLSHVWSGVHQWTPPTLHLQHPETSLHTPWPTSIYKTSKISLPSTWHSLSVPLHQCNRNDSRIYCTRDSPKSACKKKSVPLFCPRIRHLYITSHKPRVWALEFETVKIIKNFSHLHWHCFLQILCPTRK